MKKLILLVFTIILLTGCANERINGIPLEVGDTKTYETKEYVVVYEISDFNNFGQAMWKFRGILNKKDSI